MNSCAILFFFSFSNRERDARHVNLIQKILQTCNFMYSRNKSLFYIFFCVSFISISSAQFYDLFESSKKVKVIFCHLREIFSKIIYNFETINFSPCLLKPMFIETFFHVSSSIIYPRSYEFFSSIHPVYIPREPDF